MGKIQTSRQRGYMVEIPLAATLLIIILIVVLPRLPKTAASAVATIGAVGVIAALYYLIVIPGWNPNNENVTSKSVAVLKFVALSAVVSLILVGYLFGWFV